MVRTNMIIDVGANRGEFVIPIAELNPNILCLAIEPIPFLAKEIRNQAEKKKMNNVIVKELANFEDCGETRLNVSDQFSSGTSSILKFSLNSKTNKYWMNRPDIYHSKSIQVKTKTLECLLNELQVVENEVIDFIKIDTQGLDLVILGSLGKYINNVQQGMLETATTCYDSLYEGENSSLRNSITFIENLGFEIYAVRPNDQGFREYNVYFRKVDFNSDQAELQLNLPKIKIYRSDLGVNELKDSYEKSKSWKVTSPLRKLRKFWSK